MRRAMWTAAAVMAATLAACDGGGAPADAPARAPLAMANPYHDNLAKLGELQRGAALRRAVRAAGESCDRVEAAAFQQDHQNLKMWNARCQTKTYAVFLAPNGDVQVRDCASAATLRLPACRALPDAPSA